MRSYFKVYRKDLLYYAHLGEVPDQNPDQVVFFQHLGKANFIQMLNFTTNNYVGVTYFGTDPSQGVALNTLPGWMMQYRSGEYILHPKD